MILSKQIEAKCRICVDIAPLLERTNKNKTYFFCILSLFDPEFLPPLLSLISAFRNIYFFWIIFRKANFPFFNSYTCNFFKNSFLDKKKELKPANQCKRQDRKNTRKKKSKPEKKQRTERESNSIGDFWAPWASASTVSNLVNKVSSSQSAPDITLAAMEAARPPQRQKVRVWRCRWPTAKILCTLEAPAATITCTNEHLSAGKEQKNTIFEVVRQSCMDPNVVACACDSNSAGAF